MSHRPPVSRAERRRRNRDTGRRWRWWVADILNRHPAVCWSRCVDWCIPWLRESTEMRLRGMFTAEYCRERANTLEGGCCYCGKVGVNSPGENGGRGLGPDDEGYVEVPWRGQAGTA